jgi:alkylation response protein AidB-like acyl-CoA dehydrogenase
MADQTAALLASVAALAPVIEAERATLARERDLPSAIVAALRRSGVLTLWLPADLGGAELPPTDYIRVIEAVARLDGAVGWCTAIAASSGRIAGALDEDAAREIFADGRFVAGSVNPLGAAVPVADGYRVRGRWPYGSFVRHSGYTLGVSRVHDADAPRRGADGAPVVCGVLAPTGSVRIHDTWDAGGLRATGSHDFEMADLFVPERHVIAMPGFTMPARRAGPLYALPLVTLFTLSITPVPLGIARAAIDAFVELAGGKTAMASAAPLCEQPGVQGDVARAEAALRAARALLFEAVEDMWASACAGTPLTLAQRALVRLACCNVADAARRAVDLMYAAAGGTAAYERAPFARCLRDVHAACQHLAFSPRNMEAAGRVFLGLDPGTPRF